MDAALLLFAFMAGAAAFFAPCCVAMLPAYVAYAVRPDVKGDPSSSPKDQRGFARTITLAGAIPVALGVGPLMARGLGTLNLLPYEVYALLPSLDLSISLLLVGAGLVVTGLLFAGNVRATQRGFLFAILATLGFFLAFLAVGLPVALLARGLRPFLGYLSTFVGIALVLMGIFMLAGRGLHPRIPSLNADVTSPKGFFKFGIAYGIAG